MSVPFFEDGDRYLRTRDADVYLRCQDNGQFTTIPAHVDVVGRYSPHIQGRYESHQETIFRLFPSGFYPCGLQVSRASFVDLDDWTPDIVRKCLSIFYLGNYCDAAYRRICPSSIMYTTFERAAEMLRDGSTASAVDTSQDSALWGGDEDRQEELETMSESERRNDAFDRLFRSLWDAHSLYGLCVELMSLKGMLVARERLSSAFCLLLHLLAQEQPRSSRRTLYEHGRVEAFLRRAEDGRARCPGLLERLARIIVEYWDEVPFRSRIAIPGWHEAAVLLLLDERRRIRLQQASLDRPRTWKMNRESRGGQLSDDDGAGPSANAPSSSGPSRYIALGNDAPGAQRPLPEPPAKNEPDMDHVGETRGRTLRRRRRDSDLFNARRASPRSPSVDDAAASHASSRASLSGNETDDEFSIPSGDETDDELGADTPSTDGFSTDETPEDEYQEPTPEDTDEDDNAESDQSDPSSDRPTLYRLVRAVFSSWNNDRESNVPLLVPDDPEESSSSEGVVVSEAEDVEDPDVGDDARWNW